MKLIGTLLLIIGALMLGSFLMKGTLIGLAIITAGFSIIMHHLVPVGSVVLILIGYILLKSR